jgi:hypothetical protein
MSSENLQILITAIAAFATVVYAILTIILVRETIKLRQVQTEPEIIVYLQILEDLPNIFDIVVRNIGGGTAYNLRWEFDQNAILVKGRNSRFYKQNFFTKGADYFAPGQIYYSTFGRGPELLREPVPPALLLRVSYEDRHRKKYHREYNIDPMQFYGRSSIKGQGLQEIADSLKDIKKDLGYVISGFSRLNINTYDSSDRNKENKAEQKIFMEQQKQKTK